ncbi:MarR family winged helix-turn-helix transcriptional regulator [Chitinophaga sancti]|uniref:MarR family winged helix-turn-helix transcriptional regulator n=1 Tax=Chitinophaga sancti TaxID=1004 RepID=UPI002A7490B8|nr:MarR family winged helix-turn-helix transcriptional regulator [Chitinophaga sancti]WPQ60370.1 MarR family winged helix-turn-helix transcriptional regulator [Chitinophaga sancti]
MTKNQTFSDFTDSLGILKGAFKARIRAAFKENDIPLTTEMLQVMRVLWKKDGVKQQEIADAISKDKVSIVYLLDNMTKRGFLERREDIADRRNKIIILTAEGKKMRSIVEPLLNELMADAVRNVSKDDLAKATGIFQTIIKTLQEG